MAAFLGGKVGLFPGKSLFWAAPFFPRFVSFPRFVFPRGKTRSYKNEQTANSTTTRPRHPQVTHNEATRFGQKQVVVFYVAVDDMHTVQVRDPGAQVLQPFISEGGGGRRVPRWESERR